MESLRRSRQLQQVQLADIMGINSCYVSAIENGKKGPPSKGVLDRLVSELALDDREQGLLWEYVDQSKRTRRLPDNATADEYALMRDIERHLGALSKEQIEIIRNTLRLGGLSKTKSIIEIRRV